VTGRRGRGLALAALLCGSAAAPAHAVEVCAWIDESVDAEDFHDFKLWLEADADVEVFYMLKGQGVVREGSKSHAPNTGSASLSPKEPLRVWGFGTDYAPPAEIDIVAELHAPSNVFAEDETPLLASFTFQRKQPADEKAPPKVFAARQCAALKEIPPEAEKPQS
jgi:hypothetical protein